MLRCCTQHCLNTKSDEVYFITSSKLSCTLQAMQFVGSSSILRCTELECNYARHQFHYHSYLLNKTHTSFGKKWAFGEQGAERNIST